MLWIIFGGLVLAAFCAVIGLILCLTIIGIPFGTQCIKFANLMLFPFGREVVYGSSTVSLLLNICGLQYLALTLLCGHLLLEFFGV